MCIRDRYLSEHVKGFIEIHEDFVGKWKPTRDELVWMSEYAMNSGPLWNTLGPSLLAMRGLASEEQCGWWLERLLKMKIILSYAQTELGHGSNVRGLRTTAVYDKHTEQFVLNTPDLLSTKWWPGGMGKVATHVLLYAQLIVEGESHGLQTFFVQIRDHNHAPLPGLEMGDLGPKMGDHATDTSYMRLSDVRIPRQHMLAKHQHVTADGTFVRQAGAAGKSHYVSMLFTRGNLIRQAGGALARAVTVAARYSCIRKQGFVEHSSADYNAPEQPVIQYSMQLYRVTRAVCTAYALKFVGRYMLDRFKTMEGDGADGAITIPPAAELSELAATSAGLKGITTAIAANGIEDCRQCCGGNGYLLSSGVAQLWGDYVWWVTAEGDTVVMQMQLAKFLMKTARKPGTAPEQFSYLAVLAGPCAEPTLPPLPTEPSSEAMMLYLVQSFRVRALVAVMDAKEQVDATVSVLGVNQNQAMDSCMVPLCHAAKCHCQYLMLRSLVELGVHGQHTAQVGQGCKAVLARVAILYGLSVMMDQNWHGLVQRADSKALDQMCQQLCLKLRDELVALVDAFEIPDRVLNSTLGRSDGKVYEALLRTARSSELNRVDPFDGYKEYLQPRLDLDFLKRGNALADLKAAL
eukprot:TRINITY_DN8697_c0_g1_i3.p1 TRINITY_DN8697_c0_g1~~TRINITY_DN8697_c0_g1_i3.p1  ORF type:complete len:633 (-),score=177.35 TRINITY_DN8697_c0_g1_i3:138-2036(-)